jgi:hypothetical protein
VRGTCDAGTVPWRPGADFSATCLLDYEATQEYYEILERKRDIEKKKYNMRKKHTCRAKKEGTLNDNNKNTFFFDRFLNE